MLRDLSDYNGDGADFHSCNRRMREWAEEKGVFIALDDFYESVTFLEAAAPGQPIVAARHVRPLARFCGP